ncbi:MAG: hypothetical protein Q4F29_10585 [Lachnospiraceae bacterium]|nr:hypothetical protein [Lachnospiraceae bacterium]
MEKDNLKLTDFDYLIGDHHLQMIKAALPYVQVPQQKFISLLVKGNELMRTAELFQSDGGGEMGICSMEADKASPIEMLNAMKPYGTRQEQDTLDVIINLLQGFQLRKNYQDASGPSHPGQPGGDLLEKLKPILSPEQQARIENIQLMMQTMQAFV